MHDVANPVSLRSFTARRMFLPSLILRNTSSFLTRSAQLIFSIILQHHVGARGSYVNGENVISML